jgi:DNA-binding NtrC family response regulator
VQAIKIGAEEYLTKPFTDKELFDAVQHAFNKLSTRKKINKNLDKKVNFKSEFIGESSQIEKVYYAISKAADTIATVLITGESGTGKELIARAIHYNSKRASAPFMPINCGGIPNELFESELFGYKKGAFTGASETRKGFFQAAEGGTIFLDEISEMTLPMQVKILRALQEKEIFMVGDRRGEKTDVRVIAATNKDLLSLINKDLFREDLYFRLNILSIEIPPLRNRTGDIPLLINFFNKKISEEQTKPLIKFSDRAIQALQNYYWPGNVRELENVIHRIAIMNDDKIIEVSDLPLLMRFSTLRKTALNKTLAEVEKEYITNVLAGANGNKSKAAKILGIDRKTLRTKLNKIVDSEKY